ncbi:MAG: DUF1156 domain-containing protein [Actinomycetota bacterium]
MAVLINKALIEIPPRWADHPPVHPEAENRTRWKGAEGLAEDVRRYGKWMRDEAEKRIGHLYPKATLPDGSKANVIAWIWARTVPCPNPACGATLPLVRSFWLGKKMGSEAWIKPVIGGLPGAVVVFEIGHGKHKPDLDGTVTRSGAQCLSCSAPVPLSHIRFEGRAGRMGAQLMAVAADGDRQRVYLPPTEEHVRAANVQRPSGAPVSELPKQALGFRVQGYGMTEWADLFTNRQLTALTTFSELVGEARSKVKSDSVLAGFSVQVATSYADAIATYLAFVVSRLADRGSTICGWDPNPSGFAPKIRNTFARQAVPMTWDYAEGDPFSNSTANALDAVDWIAKVIERTPASGIGVARQADARAADVRALVATDPPYYDNIGYADLSDFFYVWLRESLRAVHPSLFETMVTPKSAELIATPFRHGGSRADSEAYFEEGFVDVFQRCRELSPEGLPMTLFYAFKQAEKEGGDGVASTGWSTMLEGLAASGWMVTATWPMRTELANKIGMKANMLASSVVLACRPRSERAGVTDRQGLIRTLQDELPGPLRELQKAHIAPVDLRQAAIGPGMAVFSRFARVIEPDGSTMRVRTALGLINQVLGKVLDEQEEEFDSETRWAIQWFRSSTPTRVPTAWPNSLPSR